MILQEILQPTAPRGIHNNLTSSFVLCGFQNANWFVHFPGLEKHNMSPLPHEILQISLTEGIVLINTYEQMSPGSYWNNKNSLGSFD